MAFLSSLLPLMADLGTPTGFWVAIIKFFNSFITDYGWCVIVFTIVLRVLLLPLDFYQKKVAYDNKKKTEAMEPYMEKLRKQYGNDKMAMSAKQRELQKKFKYNTFGPCLPAILSLVIFITLFGGFRKIADAEIYKTYNDTKNAYVSSYTYGMAAEEDTDQQKASKETIATEKSKALYKIYIDTIDEYNKTLDPANYSDPAEYEKAKAAVISGVTDEAYFETNFIIFLNNDQTLVDNPEGADKPKIDLNANINGNGGANRYALNNLTASLLDAVKIKDPNNAYMIYDGLLRHYTDNVDKAAVTEYNKHKDGMKFLWIKNMWRPDALWGMNGCGFAVIEPVVPNATLYLQSLTSNSMKEYKKAEEKNIEIQYPLVMKTVIAENNTHLNAKGVQKTTFNGYYILAVLIIGLSILSSKFNAAGNPAAAPQQAAGANGMPGAGMNMKMMMWMMPIMMGFFAISSNSAFSVYMVASTATSLLSTLLCTLGIKWYDKKKTAKAEENKFKRYVKK